MPKPSHNYDADRSDESDRRSPMERLEDFTRRIIAVPHSEIPKHVPKRRKKMRKRR